MNPTWWMALVVCVLFHIPFLYMTDANVQIERLRSKRKRWIKQIVLGGILFKLCSGFLYAGTANKHLYTLYGVPEHKLHRFAYSWGYRSSFELSAQLKPQRNLIRAELGIPEKDLVTLFCGRLSREKNLFHLIDAYHRIDKENKSLVLVGDGELRESLQIYVEELGAQSVHFAGFQNRDQISKFYAISDIFVLPSIRETWGIVVNEAMSFGLPVIVSDQVGAGEDLIAIGQNGYRVGTDGDSLFHSLHLVACLSDDRRISMGQRSVDIIKDWLNRDLAEVLILHLEDVWGKKGNRAK
jgi:glycosyltransferase involved in cell wall biosynthesis